MRVGWWVVDQVGLSLQPELGLELGVGQNKYGKKLTLSEKEGLLNNQTRKVWFKKAVFKSSCRS